MAMAEPQRAEPTTASGAPITGYAQALQELDRILVGLEDERVDVDHLGSEVRRAGELVAFCRQRILAARLEVEQVTSAVNGPGEGGRSAGLDGEPAP
jgi:exodeoxyribonuclease VII small subunit